ncbi:jg22925 [Pararge aegeria aegeria]|uniref:Jg22925 protein n=1 Tax=Pararge aegeria aegeria TaxID=348720 RepID=A0A8S4RM33_9NEOP|nr:jg22925 [Pararge aegeria aegeria]
MPHDLKGLAARKALMAPLSPTPCAEISDDELVSISVRDLNRQLKMRGLSRDQIINRVLRSGKVTFALVHSSECSELTLTSLYLRWRPGSSGWSTAILVGCRNKRGVITYPDKFCHEKLYSSPSVLFWAVSAWITVGLKPTVGRVAADATPH